MKSSHEHSHHSEVPAETLDHKFEKYKKYRLITKVGVRRIKASLDQLLEKDEEEYLDGRHVPMTTRVSLVSALSRLNDRSGYTKIFLSELRKLLLSLPSEIQKSKISILDIGCGGGGLIRALYHWGLRNHFDLELHGIDLSKDFVAMTQARLNHQNIPAQLSQGDACRLENIADNTYDIVISNYMTHHIRSAQKVGEFLSEVYRISKKGWLIADLDRRLRGLFFVGVAAPIFGAPPLLISDGIKSLRRAYKTHEMNFILGEMQKDRKATGMNCTSYPFFPYWLIKGKKEEKA